MKNTVKLLLLTLFLTQSCKTNQEHLPKIEDLNRKLQLLEERPYINADSTLRWLSASYQVFENFSYTEGMARCKFMMGNIFLDIGSYSQAMNNLKDASFLFQQTGNNNEQADVKISLSVVYLNSSDLILARQFAEEAVQLYQKTANKQGLAEAYGMLGHFFEKTQAYNQAIQYQNLALQLYEAEKDTLGLAFVHDNIGSIYEDLSNFSRARHHFEIAYQFNMDKYNLPDAIVNLNNLGDVHRKLGDMDKALGFTRKAYLLADDIDNNLQLRSAMRDLAKIYRDMGQLDSAYYFLESSYDLTRTLFGKQTAEEVGKMKTLFEVAQKEERIAYLQREQKQDRLVMTIIVIATGIVILFGFFLAYQIMQKSRKEREIMEIQAELTHAELENTRLNEQNLKKELENKRLLENHLAQKLELKTKSMTTSTLQLIQKNEFLQQIRKQLDDLKKTDDPKTKQQVKKIIRSIDLKFNLEEDWSEFEHVFEQVHEGFFEKLQKEHPNLTSSEVRLCALVKLNLPSRNIATIMGISSNSLRIARYRLKKKLNLNKEINLYSYLYSVDPC